jgi:hypothetical protein
MGIQNMPLTGAVFEGGLMQAALAASKLRLITGSFNPGPNDTLAALEAQEATFDGYTAGGYALTTWLAPSYSALGGVVSISPQIDPNYNTPSDPPVQNTVTGWFLVDATGKLIADGTFTQPQFMGVVGDAFVITLALLFGTTLGLVQCWVDGVMQ